MTVVLNEAALQLLLRSEAGPVGKLTIAATALVRERAEANAKVIMHSQPQFVDVGSRVDVGVRGPEGRVGISGEGSISEYLNAKAEREKGSGGPGDWLASSLDVLRDFGWTVTG